MLVKKNSHFLLEDWWWWGLDEVRGWRAVEKFYGIPMGNDGEDTFVHGDGGPDQEKRGKPGWWGWHYCQCMVGSSSNITVCFVDLVCLAWACWEWEKRPFPWREDCKEEDVRVFHDWSGEWELLDHCLPDEGQFFGCLEEKIPKAPEALIFLSSLQRADSVSEKSYPQRKTRYEQSGCCCVAMNSVKALLQKLGS